MKSHVHWFKFFITLFLTIPSAIVFFVCIGVGGCLCSISSSDFHYGMASSLFIYRDPSLDFAAEDITVLMICAKVGMSPLFGGSGESLYMKKWPPTLFLEFVSDR